MNLSCQFYFSCLIILSMHYIFVQWLEAAQKKLFRKFSKNASANIIPGNNYDSFLNSKNVSKEDIKLRADNSIFKCLKFFLVAQANKFPYSAYLYYLNNDVAVFKYSLTRFKFHKKPEIYFLLVKQG